MTRSAVALVAALLLAACGGEGDGDSRPEAPARPAETPTATPRPDLAAACAEAARELEDPLAYVRRLDEPPAPTSTEDAGAARLADRHRGTRKILQRVYEAAAAPEQARYRRAVNALIGQLDDAELSLRQDYDIAEMPGRLVTRWRRVERAAPPACRAVRRPGYAFG